MNGLLILLLFSVGLISVALLIRNKAEKYQKLKDLGDNHHPGSPTPIPSEEEDDYDRHQYDIHKRRRNFISQKNREEQ